jgi:hypothetical protein
MRSKCVHIIGPPIVSEEVAEIAMPRIHAYANRIGADVNVIGDKREFPSYPIAYERLQIYEAGREYEWNLSIDSDLLLGSDLIDPTAYLEPRKVSLMLSFPASECFSVDNRFFARDARNVLPVQWFLVASHLTHELWEPLKGEPSIHIGAVAELNRMAEYAYAYNVAKYGLELSGVFPPSVKVFRAEPSKDGQRTAEEVALDKLREWGEL